MSIGRLYWLSSSESCASLHDSWTKRCFQSINWTTDTLHVRIYKCCAWCSVSKQIEFWCSVRRVDNYNLKICLMCPVLGCDDLNSPPEIRGAYHWAKKNTIREISVGNQMDLCSNFPENPFRNCRLPPEIVHHFCLEQLEWQKFPYHLLNFLVSSISSAKNNIREPNCQW